MAVESLTIDTQAAAFRALRPDTRLTIPEHLPPTGVVYTQDMASPTDTPKDAYVSVFDRFPNAGKRIVGKKPAVKKPAPRCGINWSLQELLGEGEEADTVVIDRMVAPQLAAEKAVTKAIADKKRQQEEDAIAARAEKAQLTDIPTFFPRPLSKGDILDGAAS